MDEWTDKIGLACEQRLSLSQLLDVCVSNRPAGKENTVLFFFVLIFVLEEAVDDGLDGGNDSGDDWLDSYVFLTPETERVFFFFLLHFVLFSFNFFLIFFLFLVFLPFFFLFGSLFIFFLFLYVFLLIIFLGKMPKSEQLKINRLKLINFYKLDLLVQL